MSYEEQRALLEKQLNEIADMPQGQVTDYLFAALKQCPTHERLRYQPFFMDAKAIEKIAPERRLEFLKKIVAQPFLADFLSGKTFAGAWLMELLPPQDRVAFLTDLTQNISHKRSDLNPALFAPGCFEIIRGLSLGPQFNDFNWLVYMGGVLAAQEIYDFDGKGAMSSVSVQIEKNPNRPSEYRGKINMGIKSKRWMDVFTTVGLERGKKGTVTGQDEHGKLYLVSDLPYAQKAFERAACYEAAPAAYREVAAENVMRLRCFIKNLDFQ